MDRLAAMQAFVRVVETGSFSAAARALSMGQPAISKTVAQLELRLGVRLLMRSTRGLAPTEAGQSFYERAKRSIEEADGAEAVARDAGKGLTGRLRISAGVTFARLHIVPHLPKFLAAHPGLTMDVLLDDRIVDLIEEGVDIALRMGALVDSTSLTARKLASCGHHVLGTPAYFARSGVPATPAELAGHAAVVYTQQGPRTWCFRQGATEVPVSISGPLRMSAAEGVRAAVLADIGLTITAAWMFGPELASGAVQRVLTEWSLPPLDLWAVYPTGRMPSAKARAFATFVEAELNRSTSGLE